MGAPKGNQFWKLRSEHGREKLFESADLLWEAAQQYFNWCDGHPWYKVEAARQGRPMKDEDGNLKEPDKLLKVPNVIPYTLSGLTLYLDASERYWSSFRSNIRKTLDDNINDTLSEDFLRVIERIETIIKTQKLTGAAVGVFNANIISRELGMADKIEARNVDKDGNDVKPLGPPTLNIVVKTAEAPISESEED
jgi:hypothetical protein